MPVNKAESKTQEPEKAVDTVRHETSDKDAASDIQLLEGPGAVDYAKDLAFMNEKVEVTILPSQNQADTTQLVTITVNGKAYHMLRGQPTVVPRFVLEILAKSKKEAWTFGYKKNADGSTSDTDQMSRILRYPHQFKDENPEGIKWYDSIKDGFL